LGNTNIEFRTLGKHTHRSRNTWEKNREIGKLRTHTKIRNTLETNTEVGNLGRQTPKLKQLEDTHVEVETLGKNKSRCWNTWVTNMKLGTLRRH
jgi:hypothetical protein